MANILWDNTYIIQDSSLTALPWPSGARIANVVFVAQDTTALARFLIDVGTPILEFRVLTQGAGTSIMPATQTVELSNVRYPTAWIPTMMTACTAWINFA